MENEKKAPGFFEAPPQTMFLFGLVSGIAVVLIAQSLLGGGMTLKGNNNNVAVVPNAPTGDTGAPTTPTNVNVPAVGKDDYVRGNRKAKIVLYEYSDLQCPFCQRHHSTMNALVDQYGDDIAWVYRHLPLTSIHPQAEPSALAAECVGEQKGDEGFFKFVDEIFANQATMGPDLYTRLAQAQGVDMNQYNECVSSQKYLSKINAQAQAAVGQGIGATPSTVVDGQLIEGAESLAKFTAIIDSLK